MRKPLLVTQHAADRMRERVIDESWVFMTVETPDERTCQSDRETRWRLWRRIPQNDDRILCVILDEFEDRSEVVTVFFDRRKKP